MIEFQEFPKMARLSRDMIVTEKIDGTNASILVERVDPPIEGHPSDRVEAGWLYVPVGNEEFRLRNVGFKKTLEKDEMPKGLAK